jgi:trans-aconitate methyltransferase
LKQIVNQKDNWNASLYDRKHSFVSYFGSELIDLLAPQKGERILDLGCGTGDLAKKLFDMGGSVIGIDKSENMIHNAQRKYPELSFIVQDVTNLAFTNELDAVFSNAALHWVKEPKLALQQIHKGLKENGRFVAEFGGKGNVQSFSDEIIHQIKEFGFEFHVENFPWYFPSIGEYTSLMEAVGFTVTFAHYFERPTILEGSNGFRNWIEMFGDSFFRDIPEDAQQKIIESAEQNLRKSLFNQENNSWLADYKRIRVMGLKN